MTPESVAPVVLKHFRPRGLARRLGYRAVGWLDRLLTDEPGDPVVRHAIDPRDGPVCAFLGPQRHLATEYCGQLDPIDLDEYLRHDGFGPCERALEYSPERIIDEVEAERSCAAAAGRGFPTARKWAAVREAPGEPKYVICNGDEGDPGAFMDRMLLESFPYRVIEGMAIAARAVGAEEGIFYIRAEYPLAVERIREALRRVRTAGLAGRAVMGSRRRLRLSVKEGAGAFVCGEETALMASIEGRRGMPRLRPPYPAENGLWGQADAGQQRRDLRPAALDLPPRRRGVRRAGHRQEQGHQGLRPGRQGPPRRADRGAHGRDHPPDRRGDRRRRGRGPAVQGRADRRALRRLRARRTGRHARRLRGPVRASGRSWAPAGWSCWTTPTAWSTSPATSSSSRRTSRAASVRSAASARGGCSTSSTRICEGSGKPGDLDELEELAVMVKAGSLCGLGKTAPNPVLSTLRYFRDEYEAHLAGRCPAGRCKALIRYRITDDCIGCTLCAQHCPADAIPMTPYVQHHIDPDKCTRCDTCRQVCPADAVIVESEQVARP